MQGEGPLLGVRQILIRLGGCNLSCAFCDTPQARRPAATCRIETEPGTGRYEYVPNTLSVEDVTTMVKKLRLPGHHSIAVTGGEPLVQADFLRGLLPSLKSAGFKTYLETNSTMPDDLEGVVEHVDFVAADIKLPSSTLEPERFEENARFLGLCDVSTLIVKIVVTEDTVAEEFLKGVEIARDSGRKPIVVLQPVTGRRGEVSVGGLVLLDLQRRALEVYGDVRVIPRVQQFLRLA